MKSQFLLAWLVVGVALTISRLAAQDVTVTDPAWFDPENAPADQLPQFKKSPKPDFPDELKKPEQVAYAIVEETLDEKGKRMRSERIFSNPYLEKATSSAVEMEKMKYVPALRGGKAVMVSCWFGIIFNPRSASPVKDEATPRLLAVAPIVVGEKELPVEAKIPLVIWATLSLDAKGQLQKFVFDEPVFEALRPQVGGSLHVWRFAPARRGGQAMAAELRVPLILNQPYKPKLPGTQPRVVHKKRPVYPRAMLYSRMNGEVLLEFVIDKTGAVENPIIKETNNPGFNEAAIDALKEWRFEPGRVGGEPVNTRMQLPFIFSYDSHDAHDYATVKQPLPKNWDKIPEQYRYDIAPQAKGVLTPVYPYSLLHDRVKGKAVVAFLIDAEGRIANVWVVEATRPEFGLAMVASAEAFSFIPALKDGKPTQAILKMEQEFTAGDAGSMVAEKDIDLFQLEEKHPEKILSAKKLDTPLKPISRRSPVFPASLQDRLDRGSATVEILIDEEGKVCLPRIAEATDPAFGYAAIQAVIDWRFEPPMARGDPAVVRVKVPFKFELTGSASAGTAAAEKRADEAEGNQR